MRAVSLFAGIGGFDLAMHRAGVEVHAVAEIEPKAREILARHFPQAVQFDDVRKVDAESLECDIDLVSAGWPCQGNSVAGHRKGMDDPRSGLWGEVVRVLRCTRPRWFVGENVPGLLTVNHGRDFGIVVSSLAELGYGVAWRVLDAQYSGVPQRRRRVIIVGCLGDPASAAEVLFDTEGVYRDSQARTSQGPDAARAATSGTRSGDGSVFSRNYEHQWSEGVKTLAATDARHPNRLVVTVPTCVTGEVANALTAPCGKGVDSDANGIVATSVYENQRGEVYESDRFAALSTGGGKPGQGYPAVHVGWAVRRLMPVECERLQGFPDGWTEGQKDSPRYRELGNAVAVPVIEWVMCRVVAVEQRARAEALTETIAA